MPTTQAYESRPTAGAGRSSTPACNTGVLSSSGLAAVTLDWLSATSDCTPERLRQVVGSLVNAKVPGAACRDTRPSLAYGFAVEWVRSDKRLAMVQWGGVNHDRPFVSVPGVGGLSGFMRQELATTGYGFTTRATRVDVAMDFRGVPFEALSTMCGTPSKVIEHADPEVGNTHYFGARQSRHYVRAYEKGKQMGLAHLSDWCRVEVEVKPDKPAAREAAMRATLPELIRSGRIGTRIADAVGVEGDPFKMGAARKDVPHDLMQRLGHLRKQYLSTLLELGDACGDDLDLFLTLLFDGPSEAAMEDLAVRR